MVHPFFKISPLKRVLSFLVPVTVANSSSIQNPFLEFILYRNQWQLATEDALYSDGDRYKPFRVAFKQIPKQQLSTLENCLILGTGLGSIVQILNKKYKSSATFSLVEHDDKILRWAMESLTAQGINNLNPHCDDALTYVKKENKLFDLICIDIFNGREVPAEFTEMEFLLNTQRLLKPGGIWVMNYIINDTKELATYLRHVKEIFPTAKIIQKEQNRILISRQTTTIK